MQYCISISLCIAGPPGPPGRIGNPGKRGMQGRIGSCFVNIFR